MNQSVHKTVTRLHMGHFYELRKHYELDEAREVQTPLILIAWKIQTSKVFRISSFGFHIRNIVVQYRFGTMFILGFKSVKLTQTLIKRGSILSESDFLAVCPTGADVREDLKGALHGADISAEAWGSSLLRAF